MIGARKMSHFHLKLTLDDLKIRKTRRGGKTVTPKNKKDIQANIFFK